MKSFWCIQQSHKNSEEKRQTDGGKIYNTRMKKGITNGKKQEEDIKPAVNFAKDTYIRGNYVCLLTL